MKRSKDGRYARQQSCQGGCGKRIDEDAGTYASHHMTDCIGDDGERWADEAIFLCNACGTDTQNFRNLSEFQKYRDNRIISKKVLRGLNRVH